MHKVSLHFILRQKEQIRNIRPQCVNKARRLLYMHATCCRSSYKETCILPTQCVCGFLMIRGANSDCFRKHLPVLVTYCVYCEVGSDFLYSITFGIQRDNPGTVVAERMFTFLVIWICTNVKQILLAMGRGVKRPH